MHTHPSVAVREFPLRPGNGTADYFLYVDQEAVGAIEAKKQGSSLTGIALSLQHVKTLLKIHGGTSVVVPDHVLFEGGAGETVRRKLLHERDVHTLLRLPSGIFYAQGVTANVLFFHRKPASATPWTRPL